MEKREKESTSQGCDEVLHEGATQCFVRVSHSAS